MNVSEPDAAPTEKLNRILWGSVKGWKTPYPTVKQSLFFPLAVDIDDDDREELEEKKLEKKADAKRESKLEAKLEASREAKRELRR